MKASRVVNSKAIYPCYNTETNESEPWVSDGTVGSFAELKDIFPGAGSGEVFGVFGGNGKVLFFANDGSHGRELWATDGTTAGTQMLLDLNPGEAGSIDEQVAFLSIFFAQNDSESHVFPVTIGKEQKLIYTDGTLANTKEIIDLPDTGSADSNPSDFAAVGENVIFAAQQTNRGKEPFITSGKKKGTKVFKKYL